MSKLMTYVDKLKTLLTRKRWRRVWLALILSALIWPLDEMYWRLTGVDLLNPLMYNITWWVMVVAGPIGLIMPLFFKIKDEEEEKKKKKEGENKTSEEGENLANALFTQELLEEGERKVNERVHRRNAEMNLAVMPILMALSTVAVVLALLSYILTFGIWILFVAIGCGIAVFIIMAVKTWGKHVVMPRIRTGVIIAGSLLALYILFFWNPGWNLPELGSNPLLGGVLGSSSQDTPVPTEAATAIPTPTSTPQDIVIETGEVLDQQRQAEITQALASEAEDQLSTIKETNEAGTQLIRETHRILRERFEGNPYNRYHMDYEVLLNGTEGGIGNAQIADIVNRWFNTHHMEITADGAQWIEGVSFSEKVRTLQREGHLEEDQAGTWLIRGENELELAQLRLRLLNHLAESEYQEAQGVLEQFNQLAGNMGSTTLPEDLVTLVEEAAQGRPRPTPTPRPAQSSEEVEASLLGAATATPKAEEGALPPSPTSTPIRCSVEGPPGCECPQGVVGRYLGALDGQGTFAEPPQDFRNLTVFLDGAQGKVLGALPGCQGVAVQLGYDAEGNLGMAPTWTVVQNRTPNVADGSILTAQIPEDPTAGNWVLYADGEQVWPPVAGSASAPTGACTPDDMYISDITGSWCMAWAMDATMQVPMTYQRCPEGGAKITRTSDGAWFLADTFPTNVGEGAQWRLPSGCLTNPAGTDQAVPVQ